MNNHVKGLLGVVTTASGAVIAWLPLVNIIIQIMAGIVAIVAGTVTARYYIRKTKEISVEHEAHRINKKGKH